MKFFTPLICVGLLVVNIVVSVVGPVHGFGLAWLALPLVFWFRHPAQRKRLLLYGVGVAGWILAYPNPDLGFLGWVLLWPYLSARTQDDGAQWWRAAFLFGFLRAIAGFFWLGYIHFTAWIAVSVGSALVFATCFEGVLRWARFLPFALRAATGWLLFEWVHSWLIGGFPWMFLAHSQYRYLPVIQIADIFGVAGVSFVMAYASTAAWRRRRAELIVAGGLVAAVLGYGFMRPMTETEYGKSGYKPHVLLVQSSIPFSMKEGGKAGAVIERQLLSLTEKGLALHPDTDLIVWPETMHPAPHVETLDPARSVFVDSVRRNARRFQRPVIYGVNSYSNLEKLEQWRGHNAAVLVHRDGELGEIYRKQVLVPMGEEFLPRRFVSKERCDGWKRWLVKNAGYPASSDLESGERYVTLDAGPGLRCAMLICFEGLYPAMGRAAMHEGDPDLILQLVNNGWFGDTWEQRQSIASWVFRAVETRTPYLSCANGGITCAIAPSGRVVGQVDGVMQTGFLHTEVPRRWPAPRFLRGGQWILPAGLALAAAVFGLSARKNRQKRKKNPA